MTLDQPVVASLGGRLFEIYGPAAGEWLPRLVSLIETFADVLPPRAPRRWDQRDTVLITYGDQLRTAGEPPLVTLRRFLQATRLDQLINTVHLLPFYPYSSDDGFSVIDYRAVDPALGSWHDIHSLGARVDLMFDLVLNHASRESRWFQQYLAGKEPFTRYFIETDPAEELSLVTRPRNLPLLTPFETSRGPRHIWTTFSADQVDLNFAAPEVLLEMVDVLLFYVRQGARIVRLDAIAYLWKDPGTNCIHRPQTHLVVKLLRQILDAVAPHVLLLTETNVPHEENVSYFGSGDEAQMVYQFSLPPLLLDAILNEDSRPMQEWLRNLADTPAGTTFLNFTASHDGVGVRPLEGLVPEHRVQRLVDTVCQRGGFVSTRRNPDGSDSPYELNISFFDVFGETGEADPAMQIQRFLASQAVMLALRGVPGIYFHSLVGTPNDRAAVEETGIARRINRRKYRLPELEASLAASDSPQARVFRGYGNLLAARIRQPAFHPDAPQVVWPLERPDVLAFERTSLDGRQKIAVVANVTRRTAELDLTRPGTQDLEIDLLSRQRAVIDGRLRLEPYQVVWLIPSRPAEFEWESSEKPVESSED